MDRAENVCQPMNLIHHPDEPDGGGIVPLSSCHTELGRPRAYCVAMAYSLDRSVTKITPLAILIVL